MAHSVIISNERIWELEQADSITAAMAIQAWLEETVGSSNYTEAFGKWNRPYRVFVFDREEDAFLFTLRWL